MAVLPVLEYPDPKLRTVAKEVEQVTPEIQAYIDDMLDTMYDESGIGLAATQVDIHLRIVVMDHSEERNEPMVFINPEFVVLDDEPNEFQEGCLSVPGYYEHIYRAAKVKVKALDRDGKPFEMEVDELMAVCVQHEIDHLDGKLFVDYISPLKRNRIKSKLQKLQKKRA
ncbi:peptide deformylase [Marinomonas mediterranea]|jgi:peptide deformylase (EC 3.5.1.88)|uniref:Peptide deformylase n=1 Tax=Marinomonas mediterranea (strain ATCC 700492 / JCM 21426 / NBRC 103028 / MMB-1) TaxID=717774 RepID=F2JUI8_MARM1|nr:peptide deformylase [Marinomonas mediterranea]ADZ89321.1 Peptide deformylase [Marinomonas mediterranea MMB-1]WCN07424.1 peptide deformylase [Marinomonas mediterranea]WCN11518.1 peptide deformylase [Marinomonas mediterranea]WCN15588.1 peptide deformylase [Marinomonas mediterranea MMB-1]